MVTFLEFVEFFILPKKKQCHKTNLFVNRYIICYFFDRLFFSMPGVIKISPKIEMQIINT